MTDLDRSLLGHLEPVLGNQISRPVLEQAVEYITYESATGTVRTMLRDGTQSEYRFAVSGRGRKRRADQGRAQGRVPRISRLIALALRFEGLVRERAVQSYSHLAYEGEVSRARISQLLRLTELAPAIQEELLFLPPTVSGKDVITERDLRRVASVLDWEWQMKLFRSIMDSRERGGE